MKPRLKTIVCPAAIAALWALGVVAPIEHPCAVAEVVGIEVEPAEVPLNQFWINAKVFSLIPQEPLKSYRPFTAGGVGPTGTLTLGVASEKRNFDVSIEAMARNGKFSAKVTVEPDQEDRQTQAQSTEYDLTDLVARSVDLGRDADGRVYRLSLSPTIVEAERPRQFKLNNLQLESFGFPNSPIILNDHDYLGRLSMSSSPLAWCDIPGLAKIEFSLLPLKDSKPLGTLNEGLLRIVHEENTIEISGVRNGAQREILSGGPYKVWVRWLPPTQTIEEHREAAKKHFAELRQRVQDGEIELPPGALERLEKRYAAGGRIGLNSGIRGFEPGELADDSASQ